MTLATSPSLLIKEINDTYAQSNFKNLREYFNKQNQLLNFNFLEFNFPAAVANQKIAHGLGLIPQDVIITRITGVGTATLNWALFDSANLDVTTTGACRIRFFVGSYWNFQTALGNGTSDTQQVSPSPATVASSSGFTNPMTTLGDLIVGGAKGVATRKGVGADGTVPMADSTNALGLSYQSLPARNYLYNGAFDIWQRQITFSVGAAVDAYTADRWYCSNRMGSGTTTVTQVAATQPGSTFALQMKITAGGSVGGSSMPKMVQLFEGRDALQLYNQIVSASAQIKALGNVTAATIAIDYITNAAGGHPNVDGGARIGSFSTQINNTAFTRCLLNNINIGTLPTTAGTITITIEPSAVSSGNLYDLNNGIIIEQVALNLCPIATAFARMTGSITTEYQSCLRFYEKSYNEGIFAGDATSQWQGSEQTFWANATIREKYLYTSIKRIGATVNLYSPSSGASGNGADRSAANANVALALGDNGQTGFEISSTVTINHQVSFHWTADAEM